MSDLISRRALLKQIDIDSDGERGYYGDNWKFIDTIESMPSAEKTQLSEEDATSICKCPCEYREPCDYCPYHRHGCPAEEGLKDE